MQLQSKQRTARRRRVLRSSIPGRTGTYTHTFADGVTYCYTNKHTYTYSYANGDPDSNCYSDADTHGNGKTYSYSEVCSHAKGATHSTSKTLISYKRRMGEWASGGACHAMRVAVESGCRVQRTARPYHLPFAVSPSVLPNIWQNNLRQNFRPRLRIRDQSALTLQPLSP